jgi:hypothetical protein
LSLAKRGNHQTIVSLLSDKFSNNISKREKIEMLPFKSQMAGEITDSPFSDVMQGINTLIAQGYRRAESDQLKESYVFLDIVASPLKVQALLKDGRVEEAAREALKFDQIYQPKDVAELKRAIAEALAKKGVEDINMHRIYPVPGACGDYLYGKMWDLRAAGMRAEHLLSMAIQLDPDNEHLRKIYSDAAAIANMKV